jgi:phosphoribosylglycinamide formyltransferase-1
MRRARWMTRASVSCDRMTLRLVVLISGTGSNLKAICRAIDDGSCDATIASVISDRADAAGLSFARDRGFPSSIVRFKDFPDRAAWDVALTEAVAAHAPDLVVLAGFMRIVGAPLLQRFPYRIVNVHPALLPAFPGADAPAQAITARVRVSGCTVHLVDSGVDTGPILAQAAIPVAADDTASTLHARIQAHEHSLLPRVIDAVARGVVVLGPMPTIHASVSLESALVAPSLERP